jgi:hypothetical protein
MTFQLAIVPLPPVKEHVNVNVVLEYAVTVPSIQFAGVAELATRI